jgi:GNAT superfamily N-acetyltransferase
MSSKIPRPCHPPLGYNSDRIYLIKQLRGEAGDAGVISGATTQAASADSLCAVPGAQPLGAQPLRGAPGAEPLRGVPGADIIVREVPWHHLAAVALREALAGEMLMRGTEPFRARSDLAAVFGADAETVAYTGVAFTDEGLPAGYAALRWADGSIEFAGLYVVPSHRESGTSAALLAAAEAAAQGLRSRRDEPAGDDERAGSQTGGSQAAGTRAREVLPALPLA